jgi:glycosyltransferase involved in cell wall biosynthesis
MGDVVMVSGLFVGDLPGTSEVVDEERLAAIAEELGLGAGPARAHFDDAIRTAIECATDEPYPVRLGDWSVTLPPERLRAIVSTALVLAAVQLTGVASTALVVIAAVVPHLFDVTRVRVDKADRSVVADLREDVAADGLRVAWEKLPEGLRHELPYVEFVDVVDGLRHAGVLDAKPGIAILRRSLDEPAAPGPQPSRPPRVLLVGDEWFPRKGGLSTFNRLLARGLAHAGAAVDVLVPEPDAEEVKDAGRSGVRLVTPDRVAGVSAEQTLMRRPPLGEDETPDVIIGHGRVTGPAAAVQAGNFPGAVRCHFLHMAADEIDFLKPAAAEHEVARRAEDRTDLELELAATAQWSFAVGPRLFERFHRDLGAHTPDAVVKRVDPGFDFPAPQRRTPPPGVPQILVVGRWEDSYAKGLDIAARAIGRAVRLIGTAADRVELLIRGVPEADALRLRAQVREWSGEPGVAVVPRVYVADEVSLQRDLRRASLLLMPSRAEGFGLVGVEAITAGVPVLISRESGLGQLLGDALPDEQAARTVVGVTQDDATDADVWGHHIAAVLRNRQAAFADAFEVHQTMAATHTWPRACRQLLDLVLAELPRRPDVQG